MVADKVNGKDVMNQQESLVDIITAQKDVTGIYTVLIRGKDGQNYGITLQLFLGLITANRGTFNALGMAYNPQVGAGCMEIAIHYAVPRGSKFYDNIDEIINNTIEGQKNEAKQKEN